MAYIGVSPSNGVRRKHTYTATANQTSFSGAGAEGATLSYNDSNFVDVYQNGVKLSEADYTSTSGTAIVLAQGASVSDIVEVVVYDVFSVADTVSKADGGTFDGNIGVGGTLSVTGETTLATHLNMGDGDIIKLGASADLQIKHDASNSFITDAGTGNLYLDSNVGNIYLRVNASENAIEAVQNGAVTLYHNNVAKISTTSTGATVTGEQVVSVADGSEIQNGLTIQGTAGGGYGGYVGWQDTWSGDSYRGLRGALIMDVPSANAGRFRILIATSGTLTDRFAIAPNGDITATDTSIGSFSDERLKKDVTDYTYDIEKFKEYAPKTFNWKNKIAHNDRDGNIGFSAQAVNATDSRWIGETKIDPTSPDYDIISDNVALTSKLGEKDAMYISVIKQLIAKVETLESKVTALEGK